MKKTNKKLEGFGSWGWLMDESTISIFSENQVPFVMRIETEISKNKVSNHRYQKGS